MSKSYGFMRRAIAFVGAVIITVNIVAAPQRARAVAVTASVVASVAAIMTACGVSYWAASQTDAIDYLGGKIDAYLNSLETVPVSYEDWLGISGTSQLFEVVSGGVMRFTSGVANKVLDFVRWFNSEEDITSGGSVVTDGDTGVTYVFNASSSGSFSLAQDSSFSSFSMHFDSYARSVSPAYSYAVLQMPADFSDSSVRIVHSSHSLNGSLDIGFGTSDGNTSGDAPRIGTWSSAGGFNETVSILSGQYLWVGISPASRNTPISGDLSFTISNIDSTVATPGTYAITPSDAVSVPADLTDDASFDVAPSVPLTQGMTVEQATDAVLDGVTSEDGLTSEGDTVEGAAAGWGWLADLLERIRQAVQGTQEQTAPAQYGDIQSYELNLSYFFPFCIPVDIHRGLSLLVASPEAPSFEWRVPLPDGSTYLLSVDLSQFDGVAQVARMMEFLAFVVALAVATKKLIKW